MKKFLVAILVLIALVASGIVFVWYENSKLDNRAVPVSTVAIGDISLYNTANDWTFPYCFGLLEKTVHIQTDYDQDSHNIDIEALKMVVAPENAKTQVEVIYADTKVFSGDINVFDQEFMFKNDGEYYIIATIEYADKDNGYGTARFETTINAKINRPIEYHISNNQLPQGGIALLTIKNVPENIIPTAESKLGYVRFSKSETENEYKAFIPVGYLRAEGEYPINITVGDQTKTFVLNVIKENFEIQQMYISDDVSDQTVNSDAANAEFRKYVVPLYDTYDQNIYWQNQFTQPVIARISTPYGVIRYVNDDPKPTRHGGIDIAAGLGEKIIAPNNGKVEYAGFLKLSGNTIVLDHGGGLKSYFYHMDSLAVTTGQMVQTGVDLGTVGTTGYSTGAHLHYEVKIGRESLNPWLLFDGTSPIIQK